MTAPSASNQLIIGLPETGKTTFLAALWHVVTSEEVFESLLLERLHGDSRYLNEIRDKWASSLPIGRTIQESEELKISMILKTPDGKATTEITFPDMSGEAFRHLWEERSWEKRYDDIARAASGALLFIHPNTVTPPGRIAEIVVPDDSTDNVGADAAEEEQVTDEGAATALQPWHPKDSPTQVKIVELIQFFTYDELAYGLKRLAVIVSAWDLIPEGPSPLEWLAERLPLLHQFLESNKEQLEYRVYGLSAQGGDIETETERLRRPIKQSERIDIIGEECPEHDITAPVRWVMGI
jgi:hypothetical protein